MRSILFIITLLAFLFSEAQDVFLEPRKAVSFEEAQRDLASFYAALQAVHPSLYRYIDKNELDQKFQNAIASCKDSSDDQKIHLLVRQLITSIGCGHTVAKPSKEWYAAMKGNKAILPFSVFTLNNRIFLNKSYDYDSTVYERGTEILSINGHTSFDMLEQMRAIQQRDGLSSTFVEHSIKRTFQTYNLFLYGLPSEYVIEFKMNDSTQLVSFEAEKVKAQRYDPTTDSSTSTTLIKGKAMKLSADSQLEGALIMDINRFGTGGYKRFYRKAFKEIRKQQISNLVIDLRRNGGGYFPNGARLLRYLVDENVRINFSRAHAKKPKLDGLTMNFGSRITRDLFNLMPDRIPEDTNRNYLLIKKPMKRNHFDGNVYVMIDGGSFSLSSYVASQLQKANRATFVGQETGGGKIGSNAVLVYSYTLPHSRIHVQIPYYFLDHEIAEPAYGRGVMPDYEVKYSLEDFMLEKDLESMQIKKLMAK